MWFSVKRARIDEIVTLLRAAHFTCRHPALSLEVHIALTLRKVCDLTTEEIPWAFLTAPSTLARRIVHAKAKICDARIPFNVSYRMN